MKAAILTISIAALAVVSGEHQTLVGQVTKEKTKESTKDSNKPASQLTPAELTRTKLLKTTVTGSYENVRLGDILKDWADQVDMKGEQPVMWAYGAGFPYNKQVSFSCNEKPLDEVLVQLLTKVNENLGYVVVSKERDKYDGWVRLTTTGERGTEKVAIAATTEEEAAAGDKLKLAKKLIDLGKPASAKPVLEIVVKNYPNTKAGAEAKELLEKINK